MLKRNENSTTIAGRGFDELLEKAVSAYSSENYKAAADCYKKIFGMSGLGQDDLYRFGDSLFETGDLEEAGNIFKLILKDNPDYTDALCELGNVLHCEGDLDGASDCYLKALDNDENYKYAWNNLGNVTRDKGDIDKAVDMFRRAIAIDSDFADAYYNLGNALREQEKSLEAAECYRKCLLADPENESASHLLAAVSGKSPERAPRTYVAELFDEYSESFDSELVEELQYRVPEMLFKTVSSVFPGHFFRDAADLGCGTGLAAEEFRNICGSITGIDLSEKMLSKAEEKKVYSSLLHGDIVECLGSSSAQKYDLFIAADSIIYLGRLEPVFEAVRNSSRNGAVFAFSIELSGKYDYELQKSGRYAHSTEYINSLSGNNGFDTVYVREASLRMEFGEEVRGVIMVLKRKR